MNCKGKVLILGNNVRHAKIFSLFCSDVYMAIDAKQSVFNRITDETKAYNVLFNKKTNRITKAIKRIREIKKWVKQYNISIIFVNRKDDLIFAKLAFLFKKTRPIIICTFHNSLAWQNVKKVNAISSIIKMCADGCICLALPVYLMLSKRLSSDMLLFQPNVVSTDDFSKKQSYSLSEPHLIKCIYTATIYQNKNQLFAIKIVNELVQKYNIQLFLVGDVIDEKYYIELKNYVLENNLAKNVFFLGPINNDILRNGMLKEYDIYFSTSILEMSPLNILEAKACGLPIVASHAFGQQNLINDGVDGFLYIDGDKRNAISKIEQLIESEELRERIGKNAANYCINGNNPETAAMTIKEFVNKLWARKK